MKKNCIKCQTDFEVSEAELDFHLKVSPIFAGRRFEIPAPTLCPLCRAQRRLSFRNERHLYHRKCDLSDRQIISMYSADKNVKVYEASEWWSDKFDPFKYGRDFDFSRPFFEQFAELMKEVPRIHLNSKECENSDYCNFSAYNKNCYLCFTSGFNEDCCYSNRTLNCRDCFDCSNIIECEMCYEVIDSDHCYASACLQNCKNCSDCFLGYDLKGCRNCFACFSLVNKEYCIGNKQYSQEEYERIVADYRGNFAAVKRGYEEHLKTALRKYMNGVNNEDSTGDNISSCKNAIYCFEAKELEDCAYCFNATKLKDCQDVNNNDHSELDYEVVGAESNYHQCFSDICWFNKNIFYCSMCFNSEDLFGCVGMKKGKYCVFNKQYSKEEYEELVAKIIEHMQRTGEWGEFFPASLSPFAYNETLAYDEWSLSAEQVEAEGLRWYQDQSEKMYKGQKIDVPENIADVDDSICEKILSCEVTAKPYKINPKELNFYRKLGIALPRRCPDQRHKDRCALRNERVLYQRTCDKCGLDLQSTYAPDRPETICCEGCYLKEVY